MNKADLAGVSPETPRCQDARYSENAGYVLPACSRSAREHRTERRLRERLHHAPLSHQVIAPAATGRREYAHSEWMGDGSQASASGCASNTAEALWSIAVSPAGSVL